tara:strand:- start:33 stop:209 length:177 start_codon:yes stop_codon:yes gene_type:complete
MSLPTLSAERKRKPRQLTMYKNNSGIIAKTKVSKYKKKSVLNRKVGASKSATILILDR